MHGLITHIPGNFLYSPLQPPDLNLCPNSSFATRRASRLHPLCLQDHLLLDRRMSHVIDTIGTHNYSLPTHAAIDTLAQLGACLRLVVSAGGKSLPGGGLTTTFCPADSSASSTHIGYTVSRCRATCWFSLCDWYADKARSSPVLTCKCLPGGGLTTTLCPADSSATSTRTRYTVSRCQAAT